IEDESGRTKALASVATAVAHAGDFYQAQDLFCEALSTRPWAKGVKDAEALSSIIAAMIRAGEIDQALILADEIELANESDRARILPGAATELALSWEEEAGQAIFRNALGAAASIDDPKAKARALCEMAKAVMTINIE